MRVEQGRGTTVQSRDAWNLLDPLVIRGALAYDDDMALLDNLIVVRRVLEREMARAAATRLTETSSTRLPPTSSRWKRRSTTTKRFRDFDLAFHAIVMKGSGNDVGQAIVRTIHTHAGVMRPIAAAQSRAELDARLRSTAPFSRRCERATARPPGRGSLPTSTSPGRTQNGSPQSGTLTDRHHSYDDHPLCGSALSMST